MGRACLLLAGAILPIAAVLVPRSEAADPPPLKIGMPESMFSGLPAAVVQAASKPFQSMFEKQTGLKGEVSIAKDYTELCDQLRSKKLDIAVFHGFEYAWVKQHPELIPLLVTVPGNKIQACLVVNKEWPRQRPGERPEGNCVAIPPTTKAHCRVFLESLQGKRSRPTVCGTAKLDGKSVEEAARRHVAGGNCEAAAGGCRHASPRTRRTSRASGCS